MQRWRFKDRSQRSDSCGQICTLKASARLRTHFVLQPFCLRHAHLHQSKDLRDNKPSSLPYFLPPLHLGGNLLTRMGKVTFSLAGSRPSVLLLGLLQRARRPPRMARIFIPSCTNPVQMLGHWVLSFTREASSLLLPNFHLRLSPARPNNCLCRAKCLCSPHCLVSALSVGPC